jgi:hypothetical protein
MKNRIRGMTLGYAEMAQDQFKVRSGNHTFAIVALDHSCALFDPKMFGFNEESVWLTSVLRCACSNICTAPLSE